MEQQENTLTHGYRVIDSNGTQVDFRVNERDANNIIRDAYNTGVSLRKEKV